MPAALDIDMSLLTVDQNLVDNYLARVDRFVDNISNFENTLKEAFAEVKDRFMPSQTAKTESVAQTPEPVYQTMPNTVEPGLVTADDIDLEKLLAGVDLGTPGLSV